MFKKYIKKIITKQMDDYFSMKFERDFKDCIKNSMKELFKNHKVMVDPYGIHGINFEGELKSEIRQTLKESIVDKMETLTKQDDFIKEIITRINELQLKG